MSSPNSQFMTYTVLGVSIGALLITLFAMLSNILAYTHGVFTYPLDDPYIHLAIAKNLALHAVWGITPYQFASASSSVLYPILLATIFKLTGVHAITAFIVNLVAAIVFIVVVQQWLTRQGIGFIGQLIVLLLGIFLIPLPAIVLVGMEHTLHLLFFFLFLTSFAEAFETMSTAPDQHVSLPWQVYVYGVLTLATRFESMPVVALACGLLLFRRRWVAALQLGFICFLPVLIFGIFSLAKGAFFLPNSVVLKSRMPLLHLPDILAYLKQEFIPGLLTTDETSRGLGLQRLLLLLPLTYLIFRKAMKEKISYRYLLILLMVGTVFHVSFMALSSYGRYEACLIGTSVVICAAIWVKYAGTLLSENSATPAWIAGVLAVLVMTPFAIRSWNVFDWVPLGVVWTFDQQYQMGHFVNEYYDHDGIAINDIGAVSYFSEGKKLDILGLGNNDIAHVRHIHQNTPAYFDSLSKAMATKIAIIYDPDFRSAARSWQKVASWYVPYRDVLYFYDSVSFYAVKPVDAPQLKANLQKYQPALPGEVIVRYY